MARQTITITLYKSELIYDVQNKAFLTGRSRDDLSPEKAANMKANDDDENANQVMRSIGNAYALLKTKMSEYIEANTTTASDALLSTSSNITITLSAPSNYNAATIDDIAATAHQYIVNTAVGEWFNITNKDDAAEYFTFAAANLEHLREALNKRVRPTRTSV